mmetsp:Transcript_95220/g.254612  ORF Transcript_95220/g.254612 Transcript_95220/m.254612 type:complete len:535 (+) Transcript_95220:151-1755(+)
MGEMVEALQREDHMRVALDLLYEAMTIAYGREPPDIEMDELVDAMHAHTRFADPPGCRRCRENALVASTLRRFTDGWRCSFSSIRVDGSCRTFVTLQHRTPARAVLEAVEASILVVRGTPEKELTHWLSSQLHKRDAVHGSKQRRKAEAADARAKLLAAWSNRDQYSFQEEFRHWLYLKADNGNCSVGSLDPVLATFSTVPIDVLTVAVGRLGCVSASAKTWWLKVHGQYTPRRKVFHSVWEDLLALAKQVQMGISAKGLQKWATTLGNSCQRVLACRSKRISAVAAEVQNQLAAGRNIDRTELVALLKRWVSAKTGQAEQLESWVLVLVIAAERNLTELRQILSLLRFKCQTRKWHLRFRSDRLFPNWQRRCDFVGPSHSSLERALDDIRQLLEKISQDKLQPEQLEAWVRTLFRHGGKKQIVVDFATSYRSGDVEQCRKHCAAFVVFCDKDVEQACVRSEVQVLLNALETGKLTLDDIQAGLGSMCKDGRQWHSVVNSLDGQRKTIHFRGRTLAETLQKRSLWIRKVGDGDN